MLQSLSRVLFSEEKVLPFVLSNLLVLVMMVMMITVMTTTKTITPTDIIMVVGVI